MRLIISNTLSDDDFEKFTVVSSFNEALKYDNADTIIIHKFSESDYDACMQVTRLRNESEVLRSFYYIVENPLMMVQMVVQGVMGTIYTDEFYYEDEEELLSLLGETGITTTEEDSILDASVRIVKDFIYSFARGESRVQIPAYLSQVSEAVDSLANLTQEQRCEIISMGETSLDIFMKTGELVTGLVSQNALLEKQISELETVHVNSSSRNILESNILIFPPYRYMGSASKSKVLLIRELSPCRYLTSFVLAYRHYLHYQMNKRVKLVFVHQRGLGVASKYSGFTSITKESGYNRDLYTKPIIATNNPKKEIMATILNSDAEIYIVVDRLYGNQDIVTGKVERVCAVTGRSDLTRFKVSASDCIFSVTGQEDALFTIPPIKDYPSDESLRQAGYSKVCGSSYKKLNEKLGIVK